MPLSLQGTRELLCTHVPGRRNTAQAHGPAACTPLARSPRTPRVPPRHRRAPHQGDVDPPELAPQLAVDLQQNFLDDAPQLAGLARQGLHVDDLQEEEERGGKKKKKKRLEEPPRALGLLRPAPTCEGTGVCTQHSFLMALYKSSLLLLVMQSSSCTLSCSGAQRGERPEHHPPGTPPFFQGLPNPWRTPRVPPRCPKGLGWS